MFYETPQQRLKELDASRQRIADTFPPVHGLHPYTLQPPVHA